MTFNPVSSHGNGYPLALTGATAATRYVGATASGAPATGTFAVGDFAIDQTGQVYVCTVAGTPGTWTQAGGGASPSAGPVWNPFVARGLAETIPRYGAGSATTPLATGRLYLCSINLPSGLLITSIGWYSSTIALVAGTTQIFGLYDDSLGSSSGTARALLRGTTDDTSAAWGTSTLKTLNLTSTYTTTRAGQFYLGCLVAAATPPALMGSLANTNSVLLGGAPILCGLAADVGLSALPNPAGAIAAAAGQQAVFGYVI